MAHRTNWSDLRVGIIAALGVIGVAAAILVYARVGSLHGDTFSLYFVSPEARGVIRGTELWLDGQRVGLVEGVGFVPPTRADIRGVVLRVKVLESARSHIRLDSRSDIRSGGSLISSPVLYLRSGTVRARQVVSGDTLRTIAQTDYESAASRMSIAAKGLPEILGNVKILSAEMKGAKGTVGAFAVDGLKPMRATMTTASRLMSRVSTSMSGGSIGPLMHAAGPLADRARAALAQADSIRGLLSSDVNVLGRFRRDSTLAGHIASARAELDTIRARANGVEGSVGRFQNDMALRTAIADARRQLDSLFVDMHKHPLRYVVF